MTSEVERAVAWLPPWACTLFEPLSLSSASNASAAGGVVLAVDGPHSHVALNADECTQIDEYSLLLPPRVSSAPLRWQLQRGSSALGPWEVVESHDDVGTPTTQPAAMLPQWTRWFEVEASGDHWRLAVNASLAAAGGQRLLRWSLRRRACMHSSPGEHAMVAWVDDAPGGDCSAAVDVAGSRASGGEAVASLSVCSSVALTGLNASALPEHAELPLCVRAATGSQAFRAVRGSGSPSSTLLPHGLVPHPYGSGDSMVGQHVTAVVGHNASLELRGVGLQANDTIKFVAAGTRASSECATAAAASGLEEATLADLGFLVDSSGRWATGQLTPSLVSQSDGPWRLCYRFAGAQLPPLQQPLGEPLGGVGDSVTGFAASFMLYPDFTVQAYAIVGAHPGVAVAGTNTTITLQGFGMSAGDEAFWVPVAVPGNASGAAAAAVAVDCSTAGLQSAVQLAFPFQLRLHDHVASGSAHFVDRTPAGHRLELCYRFADVQEAVHVRNASIVVHGVVAVQAAAGADNVIMQGVAKSFHISGTGIGPGDVASLQPASQQELADSPPTVCLPSAPTLALATVDAAGLVTLTVANATQLHAGEALLFCYKFADAPVVRAYASFAMHAVYIHSASRRVVSVSGPVAAASVGGPLPSNSSLALVGRGLSADDRAKYVAAHEVMCNNTTAGVAPLELRYRGDVLGALEMSFHFGEPSDTDTPGLQLCYALGDEPWTLVPNATIHVVVPEVTSSAHYVAALGNGVGLLGDPVRVVVDGRGLVSGDAVAWIPAVDGPDACSMLGGREEALDTSMWPTLSVAHATAETQSSEHSLQLGGLRVELQAAFAESTLASGPLQLCYWFSSLGIDKAVTVPTVTADVYSIANLTASSGGADVAIVGLAKTWFMAGFALSSADTAAWVPSGEDCNAATVLGANVSASVNETGGTAGGGGGGGGAAAAVMTTAEASFLFTSSSQGSLWQLCYFFNAFPSLTSGALAAPGPVVQLGPLGVAMPFPAYTLRVIGVDELAVEDPFVGLPRVAVVGVRKTITITGVGLTLNDRVKWVPADSVDCSGPGQGGGSEQPDLVLSVTQPAGLELPPGTFALSFTLVAHSNRTRWLMCYKLSSEPFEVFPSEFIEARDLTEVVAHSVTPALPSGLKNASTPEGPVLAVAGVATVMSGFGYGLDPALDSVYWALVEQGCTATSTTLMDTAPDGVRLFLAATLTSATPNGTVPAGGTPDHVYVTTNFPTASIGSLYALCYSFQGIVRQHGNYTVLVAGVSSVSGASSGSIDTAVATAAKNFTLDGAGFGMEDVAVYVSGGASASCSNLTADGRLQGAEEGLLLLPPTEGGIVLAPAQVASVSASSAILRAMFPSQGGGGANGAASLARLEFRLCYRFSQHTEFHSFPGTPSVHVNDLVAVTTAVEGAGRADTLVALVPKRLRFTGAGVASGDLVKFVTGSSCSEAASFQVTRE